MRITTFLQIATLSAFAAVAATAQAQLGTAFTYQGELAAAGTPATGTYDIRYRLYDAATGGTQIGGTLCTDDLAVVNGRFMASLDFGLAAFSGQQRYLEIEVREDTGLDCGDDTGYTALSPRQELTAAPHATFALTAGNSDRLNGLTPDFFHNAGNLTGTLPSDRLSGTYSGALNLSNPLNILSGNGAGIGNLSATNIVTGTLSSARMPTDWVAGGDLTGFYPSPTIGNGVVSLAKLESSVQSTLSSLSGVSRSVVQIDAVAWGIDFYGQATVPALPSGLTYTSVASGGYHNVALRSDGSVVAWGYNDYGQTTVPALPPGVSYTAVAAGLYHSFAFRSDGTLVSWGWNTSGQTDVPALPPGVTYTAVAGGFFHSLALRSDGTVIGWGDNGSGQIDVPALPPGLTYTAVAAGSYHSLALRSDGTLVSWGFGAFGLNDVPALPPGVTYTAAAAGSVHSLALRSDGTVVAWGSNGSGRTNVPALPSGATYTGVAAGAFHSLALRSDGTVAAWGDNSYGQTSVPALPSGATYTSVAAGYAHSLALRGKVAVALPSGLSIGTTTTPPGIGGISVAGASSFTGSLSASSFSGSGAGLTNISAANVIGTLSAAQIPGLDASKITTGVLDNARTTGTPAYLTNTLVLRDMDGNFSAGTITAQLNGNAVTSNQAINSAYLNGLPSSFFTNASNITTGTLANAQTSGTDASTPSTLVLRDASGNFAAGTVTASLNGTASNAAQLNGQAAAFYTNASNITGGTLANVRTTGTTANSINTLVLRDSLGNFAAGTITASLTGTASNAAQLNGQAAAFYTNASNILTGTLANIRTTGTATNTANTLVLRDASGNFAAGTITATLTGTASNAAQLNGQAASFYTSASNITSGTLANALTTGTTGNVANTLVLRDATGNFAAGTITATLTGTASNAAQLNGQAASFYTNASNMTAGTLANTQTSGAPGNIANALVLRDASGNFSAGTITATLTGTASNAAQLNGQAASFYTNASNLSTGTIPQTALPASQWAIASIGVNTIASSVYTTITGTSQIIAMRQGAALISWTITGYTDVASTAFSVRVKAVTNGVTTTGPATTFFYNQSLTHTTISGNAVVSIPSTNSTTFTIEMQRTSGTGAFKTDLNDSLTATVLNLGQ